MYLHIHSYFEQDTIALQYKENEEVPAEQSTVIYKTEEGEEAGLIISTQMKKTPYEVKKEFKILRVATNADKQKVKQLKKKEQTAKDLFMQKVNEHSLDMNLSTVRYSFDDTRVEFTFTAMDRVDFRELVRDLAKELRKKIHLKQIGPRDRSKIIGGVGICGRNVCCSGFLVELKSVSMDAARVQSLTHKSTEKLSGLCGKLRCCLNYETYLYSELRKQYAELGTEVTYQKQKGKVTAIDYINDRIKLVFQNGDMAIVEADKLKGIKKEEKKKAVKKEEKMSGEERVEKTIEK